MDWNLPTHISQSIKNVMTGFTQLHPWEGREHDGGALTFSTDAKDISDPAQKHIYRSRQVPDCAAFAYRTRLYAVSIRQRLNYSSTSHMMDQERLSTPTPCLTLAQRLFILHENEQNFSTNTHRSIGARRPDPFSASGASLLSTPLHAAQQAVLAHLNESLVEKVRSTSSRVRLRFR